MFDNDPERKRVHYALHKLWTKAVGTKGYVKAEWNELDSAIEALAKRQQSHAAQMSVAKWEAVEGCSCYWCAGGTVLEI